MGKRKVELTLKWTSLAFSFVLFLCFLYHSYLRLIYPYDITSADGFVLGFSLDLLRGGEIYTDVRETLKANIYPPLYYLISSPFLFLTGPSFLPGKLISLFSSFGIGIVLYFLLKRRVKDKHLPLILSLSFFSFYYTFFWSTLPRPDMLGLLFSLLGLYAFKEKKNCWLASFFFTLSFFTKQNYVSAPLAVLIYLFLVGRRRQFLTFLTTLALSFSSLFSLFLLVFGPEFFQNVFLYASSYSMRFRHNLFYTFLSSTLPLLFLFFDSFSSKDLFSIYAATSLVFMSFFLFNPGSASNYFLEPLCALLLAVTGSPLLKKRSSPLFLLLLFQLLLAPGGGVLDLPWNDVVYLNSFYQNMKADEKIMELVSTKKAMPECAGYLIFSGKEPSPDIWKLYTLKERMNLEESIRDYCSSFDYLVSFYDLKRLPECLENFRLVDKIQKRNFSSIRYGEADYFYVEIYEKR